MSNIKDGNAFEREFAKHLFNKGYWVHIVTPSRTGVQPADIIALKDGKAYLIDCKVCDKPYFLLSRIEENQKNAMKIFREKGGKTYFVCKYKDKFYTINNSDILKAESKNLKRIDFNML